MTIEPGTRLGHYEVLSSLGAGGMGEVYRAKDTKLGREVAIKLLLDEVSSDPERLARFEREARVLASLNHNNIASLHAFEREGDISFLVMELVEGETLADRIKRGAIPVDEALPVFLQIAEGLEAAHEKGVIHRDLKPANIKVSDGGQVKILDFGLAKAMAVEASASGDDGLSESPTLTLAATQRGQILGTAAYMAPEQARGKTVDKRADVWAFGVCLFEALSGKRVFQGEDASITLASVLKSEPDWEGLPGNTPRKLQELLRRCLNKDPRQRLHDIGDARIEIEEAMAAPEVDDPSLGEVATERRSPLLLVLGAFAILAVGAVISGIAAWTMKPEPPRPLVRSVLSAPPSEAVFVTGFAKDVAIAPDGRAVVYQARDSLYLRRLDQLQATALAGTEAGASPFVSPDGAWVGFAEGSALKKVSLLGGPPLTICEVSSGVVVGARWEEDGTIFFGIFGDGGLYRVPGGGGEAELVAEPDREGGELSLNYPQLLPGGRMMLLTASRAMDFDQSQVGLLNLETGERRVLILGGGRAVYVPTGHLVYAVQDGLRRVAFDSTTFEVLSDPVPLFEGVVTKNESLEASFDVSVDGSLVYVAGTAGAGGRSTLVWVDREGREEPVGAPPRNYQYPAISPDGGRVAVSDTAGQQDVWIWDFRRQTDSRLTRDPASDRYSIWTRDGRAVIFSSQAQDLYRKAADGTGEAERLTEQQQLLVPSSLSPDGSVLVYRTGGTSGNDLGLTELDGHELRPLLADDFDELNGEVSPDGRFLAYQSNESGRHEIYVRPFPEVDARRWPISTAGGTEPLWSRDGSELFYRAGDSLMAVAVRAEPTFAPGSPEVLFTGIYATVNLGRMYDVHPDGERFLMIKAVSGAEGEGDPPQVVLVEGWFEELERLVPTD